MNSPLISFLVPRFLPLNFNMNRAIIIAISLIITLVLGATLIRPKYQELNFLKLEIVQKQVELQKTKDYFANLYNISEELKKYQEPLSKIDSVLPPDVSLPSLLDYLEKIGSQNNLALKEIGSVATSISKERPAIQEHFLNLSLSGYYPSFKNFLSTLEKSARLIEIESISFSSPKERENPFPFELGIKVYSY